MTQLTPYQLFGLPETYAVDEALLSERLREAMQKVHPDRFADRSAAERRVAEQWSALINEAYETLRTPVKRAMWLAERRGTAVDAESNVRMPADFLMEQMAWREALDEAPDEAARAAVVAEVDARRREVEAALEEAFDRQNDAAKGAALARKLLFLVKFIRDAQSASARGL